MHWSCLIPIQRTKIYILVLIYFYLWHHEDTKISNDILTDMINSTSTELSKKFLSTKRSEILNYKGPQMKYIVPGDTITLFNYHNLCSQQLCLYSSTKATWSSSNNENLQSTKLWFKISHYQYFCLPYDSLLLITIQCIRISEKIWLHECNQSEIQHKHYKTVPQEWQENLK